MSCEKNLWAWMEHNNYAINEVYQNLHNSQEKVIWEKLVWSRTALPKTRFIRWLAFLNKLKTQLDLLHKIGVTPDDMYPLFGDNSESVNHLFFACKFNKKCLDATMAWLGSNVHIFSPSNLASKKRKVPVARKKIICTALSCLSRSC